jgi:HEAT repeat protein
VKDENIMQNFEDVSFHSLLSEEPETRPPGNNNAVRADDDPDFPDQRAKLFAQLGIRSEKADTSVKDIERLIASLSHIEVKKRIDAAHMIVGLYEKLPAEKQMHARINLILMIWRDANTYARIAAIKALGRTGAPDVAVALQVALRDEEQDVRAAAARALGGIRGKTPLIALIAVAKRKDEHWSVRAAAIRAMGDSGEHVFLNAVNLALDDADDSVRIAAIHALAQLDGLQAAPRLALIVQRDRKTHIKEAAILELENLTTDDYERHT